jgi:predicted metal-dependent hydrolase
VSQKNEKIAAIVERFGGQRLDPHYLAYFDCFNRQLYFEAHEVLEKIWLPQRQQANGAFYKGLIQFAGAFVHLQKGRLQPAAALLRLARENLRGYPAIHHQLDVSGLIKLIESWLEKLDSGASTSNPLDAPGAPQLALVKQG